MRTRTNLAQCLAVSILGAGLQLSAAEIPRSSEVELLTPLEEGIIEKSEGEVAKVPTREKTFKKTAVPAAIPGDFQPWWLKGQHSAIGEQKDTQRFSLDELYTRALAHSHQIRVFADLPLIRETGIQEAASAFDTYTFLEAKYEKTNEPVGSSLTTGDSSRFKEEGVTVNGGIRKRFIPGTTVELTQNVGRLDNNSIYFTPSPQSRAALTLRVTQPLLKGAGIAYNRATMQIARLDSEAAMQEFIRQSESHLLEVARTYWALYAARVTYLQKQALITETVRVSDELKGRQNVDVQQTQLFRAQSSLASRRSDLVRSEAAVRNAQDRLRALVNDPVLLMAGQTELVPVDRLVLSNVVANPRAAAFSALQRRPEITQSFLQLRAAGIREKVAKNELLPELNVFVEGSLNGLDDDYLAGYGNQFSKGTPGWGAGIIFSMPLENNAARARYERRQIEKRQQLEQVKTTIDTVLLEVKVSTREVSTAYRETQAKYEAVRAFTEDIENLQARRDLQALQDQSQVGNYLDSLLDAQDRRSFAEEEFIRAAANYQIAIVNLERSKGNLLTYENVSIVRTKDEIGLPLLKLERSGGKNVK